MGEVRVTEGGVDVSGGPYREATRAPTLVEQLRALAAAETRAADLANNNPLAVLGVANNGPRAAARAQAFNEAVALAEQAATAPALGSVSGDEYIAIRDRAYAAEESVATLAKEAVELRRTVATAALDLANARKERDEAVATAETLRAQVKCYTSSYAAGAAAERERLAKVFERLGADCDARRIAVAKADNYLAANTQQEWVFAMRCAAAECRKVPT